jgi:hypothetical protein
MLDSAIKYIAPEFGRSAWRENGAGRPLLLPQRYGATPSKRCDAVDRGGSLRNRSACACGLSWQTS